jgi:glycerol kinase
MNTGHTPVASRHRLLTTIAWQLVGEARPTYALEGTIFVTGAAVQWLSDALGPIRDAAETEALARSVPDNGGVYLVPAFVGLGAPYWDPGARGILTGSRAAPVEPTSPARSWRRCATRRATSSWPCKPMPHAHLRAARRRWYDAQ